MAEHYDSVADDKVKAKLRKLIALAERGTGGEKENASRVLQKLLDRHGLALEDLTDEKCEMHWFRYSGKFERRLASQILAKVLDTTQVSTWTSKAKRAQVGVKLTAAQAIEFEIHFSALRVALKSCFDTAYGAFVQANDIFAKTAPESRDPSPLTDKELAVVAMAMAITPTPVNPRLEGPNGH
ncbi:DUF2786 domain-containing protein [Pseudomonas tohonis]|uniref:DUF2786 domain-containing protein n=1 Tax=Pseudomonas tohonis TaxID=2725477 RepID=UPI0022F11007|nr:DUF2786 domain-containing protein [Pseudomonas tohonis]